MLCSRFKQIPLAKSTSNNNVRCLCIKTTNNILKKCWKDSFLASLVRSKVDSIKMSPIRFLLKDLRVTRFWSVWSRNINVGNVVRRCRRDRSFREVIQCVRQTFLKSRKTLLLSGSAAYKVNGEDADDVPPPCENNITDEDLQKLLTDLEAVQVLVKNTLYCTKCHERIVIDKKMPSVKYCVCKEPEPVEPSTDGWEPYMEAEDVVIWRKEYKPGHGLFAYKVYGRYSEVVAGHFAAIQVDGGYRRVWDSAVAALSIVERSANGVPDQAVLHWEVLWPRLFANRDYVYIRRHKEFDLNAQVIHSSDPTTGQNPAPAGPNPATPGQNPETAGPNSTLTAQTPTTKAQNPTMVQNPVTTGSNHVTAGSNPATKGSNPATAGSNPATTRQKPVQKLEERPSIHSNAKRKSEEMYKDEQKEEDKGDRAFVIVSRSCAHPEVPQTKHAIRVTEYWSHMVVKTLNGADHTGMEFVLTYYDEPAVGGMPPGVASWATGRAAPAFLMRMRRAALEYREYASRRRLKDPPDFTPFRPDKVSYDEEAKLWQQEGVSEEDMESSKQGPELENGEPIEVTRDQSTQTDCSTQTEDKAVETTTKYSQQDNPNKPDEKDDTEKTEDDEPTTSWWRQRYPFYYFL